MSHAVYDTEHEDRVVGVSAMDLPHRQLSGVVDQVAQVIISFVCLCFGFFFVVLLSSQFLNVQFQYRLLVSRSDG